MSQSSPRLSLYSIAQPQPAADLFVAGLQQRFGSAPDALARITLLLPNMRSARALSDSFVRHAHNGLVLPKMVAIGDLELGERLGGLLDPIGSAPDIAPAIDARARLFVLTQMLLKSDSQLDVTEALRLAGEMARVRDQLLVEEKTIADLRALESEMEADLATHWQRALSRFLTISEHFEAYLAQTGRIEEATRRNLLLRHCRQSWQQNPPAHPVIAMGVATAAPAIAALLRCIAQMPGGAVILPGLDLECDDELWQALGRAQPGDKGANDATGAETPALWSHPQFHLKMLLDAMGAHRDEVEPWHVPQQAGRGGDKAGGAAPSRDALIRSMFLPPSLSARWAQLPDEARKSPGISLIEAQNSDEEAQAIALAFREALETPGRRCALITPDRALASRVSAHLRRWSIEADDSAGRALPETAPGALLLAAAALIEEDFAPVALLALLKHPLFQKGDARRTWLRGVRLLDLGLRGPRPAPGLDGLDRMIEASAHRHKDGSTTPSALQSWWQEARALLADLAQLGAGDGRAESEADNPLLGDLLQRLCAIVERASNGAIWAGAAGRALAEFVEQLADCEEAARLQLPPRALAGVLRSLMKGVAVRPPFGQHPRIAIYGLLEARLQSADLVICGGLNEGIWPALPAPDPWLAPMIRRKLGLPVAEYRIGLSAHDLAGAMGAKEVVLSRSKREGSAPAIASRFWLRLDVVAGQGLQMRDDLQQLARQLDRRLEPVRIMRPEPMPNAIQRAVDLSVTELDRLRADPYAFYARRILGLQALDGVDAEPSAAWKGSAVHEILELWAKRDSSDAAALIHRARDFLSSANVHPVIIALWRPRLLAGLQWITDMLAAQQGQGRQIAAIECWGSLDMDGTILRGKADRIDMLADGSLAIVDYKTGKPPGKAQVSQGYALQLGLLGLIARDGQFRIEGQDKPLSGEARAFEYWSLGRNEKSETGFGYIESPVKTGPRSKGLEVDEIIPVSEAYLTEALQSWIRGHDPFTAKLNPDQAIYTDYDRLMRLDEWYGRQSGGPQNGETGEGGA